MRKLIITASAILAVFSLLSFNADTNRKKASPLTGFWISGNPANNSPAHIKMFDENGNFYNIGFERGETIITHKGKYKMVDDTFYKEKVTEQRFGGAYDLKGKEFVNRYELSKDGNKLILKGIVLSKNGVDSLKWTENYKRIELPQ